VKGDFLTIIRTLFKNPVSVQQVYNCITCTPRAGVPSILQIRYASILLSFYHISGVGQYLLANTLPCTIYCRQAQTLYNSKIYRKSTLQKGAVWSMTQRCKGRIRKTPLWYGTLFHYRQGRVQNKDWLHYYLEYLWKHYYIPMYKQLAIKCLFFKQHIEDNSKISTSL
jgi:hypothetical protein